MLYDKRLIGIKKIHGSPKLRDVWEPRIYVTLGKITWQTILDLAFNVLAVPKSLCDHLDLPL
jgi:hypothetical protein